VIFYDLQGREHRKEIKPSKYIKTKDNRSSGENKLFEKLKEFFPQYSILEQFPCVGTRLHLDFLIIGPGVRMAFEYDGRQHQEFVPHFHTDRIGWARHQFRDVEKHQWCEANNIKLIRLDNVDDLETLINE